MDLLYSLGSGDSKVTGILKGLSAQTGPNLQICLHNEVGYQQAFFDVFASFVEAFQQNENSQSFFEPIYKMTLNDIPVGYSKEKYIVDKDGDIEITSQSALLLPVNHSSIARSDSVSRSWSNPDGSLINALSYSVENSQLSSNFTLIYDEGWLVEGELQGKPVKQKLEYDGWFLSGFGSYLETARLMATKEKSAEFPMWIPEADPTSKLDVTLKKILDNPKQNFEIKMGPIVMNFLANDKGGFKQGSLKQGPLMLSLELIQVSGEPVLP